MNIEVAVREWPLLTRPQVEEVLADVREQVRTVVLDAVGPRSISRAARDAGIATSKLASWARLTSNHRDAPLPSLALAAHRLGGRVLLDWSRPGEDPAGRALAEFLGEPYEPLRHGAAVRRLGALGFAPLARNYPPRAPHHRPQAWARRFEDLDRLGIEAMNERLRGLMDNVGSDLGVASLGSLARVIEADSGKIVSWYAHPDADHKRWPMFVDLGLLAACANRRIRVTFERDEEPS